jgi:hypothetical protein
MITYLEKAWLNSRGGRTEDDVKKDDRGQYVLMASGKQGVDMKVYIPTGPEISAKLNSKYKNENTR